MSARDEDERGSEDTDAELNAGTVAESHAETVTAPALWGSTRAYKLVRIGLGLLLTFGLGIMLYPMAQRLEFAYKSVMVADEYQRYVESAPEEMLEHEWMMAQEYNRARAYNLAHDVNVIADPFRGDAQTASENAEYWSLVNPLGNGLMGYLDIPKIGERLNVYHGTEDEALLRGLGHIQGTSLPVGGDGTHCVLSGHRGLAGAKILTDLDQVEVGDVMLVHVLNHHLAYEVDRILVVLPDEISAIDIVEGQDLLTLITCTPYAVNTHRLLVTGHRVPYVEEPMPMVDLYSWLTPMRIALVVAAVVVVSAIVVWRRRRSRRAQ